MSLFNLAREVGRGLSRQALKKGGPEAQAKVFTKAIETADFTADSPETLRERLTGARALSERSNDPRASAATTLVAKIEAELAKREQS